MKRDVLAGLLTCALAALPFGAAHSQNGPSTAGVHLSTGETVPANGQGKPPLHLTDAQRQKVLAAVLQNDTKEKLPDGFDVKIGTKITSKVKLTTMPRPLVYEIPALKQYDYAKFEKSVAVVDPLTKTVADVIER